MSLQIEEPLFFRITTASLLRRTTILLGRLWVPLASLALGLAALHFVSPFSREPLEFLESLGAEDVSTHDLLLLVPLYLGLILTYVLGMAELRGEETPSLDAIGQEVLDKLPFTAFMVILETVSPNNSLVIFGVVVIGWFLREKLVWDPDGPHELDAEGKRGAGVFLTLLVCLLLLGEVISQVDPVAASLAYGAIRVVLFASVTVLYHDYRLVRNQVDDSEEEVQRALAEAREAQAEAS